MSIKSYYHERFASHLSKMVVRHSPGHPGYVTHYEIENPQRGVRSLSIEDRPYFVLCLFFTVLIDQAMYAYGPGGHNSFKTLTKYPTWGVLGGANSNPWGVIGVALCNKLVKEPAILNIADEAMQLFVDEVEDYFRKYLPQDSAKEFLAHMQADPDFSTAFVLRAGEAGMALYNGFVTAVSKLHD